MPTFGGMVVATGVEADGRRTLLDVVDELARPIDASDPAVRSLAGDAFRAAVRTMNRKGCWPWELQNETLVQTINSPNTTVQGAIKKPLAMYYINSSNLPTERIGYIEYETFVETYDLSLSGRPCLYTIGNLFETGQIRWVYIPTSAESCQFTFYRVTPAPRVESEAVEVPDYAIEVYTTLARWNLSKILPAAQARYSLADGRRDSADAFRELSAHVNAPGDRMQYGG